MQHPEPFRPGAPDGGDPVWVWYRGNWVPGSWLRTINGNGKRAGHYVVWLRGRERIVPPDACRARKDAQ